MGKQIVIEGYVSELDVRYEDGNQAVVIDVAAAEDVDEGVWIKIVDWSETKDKDHASGYKHDLYPDTVIGKTVKVTIEILEKEEG